MAMTASERKAQLVAEAQKLGFARARIAPATPPPHADAYLQWLAESAQGDMQWMERSMEKRRDPQKVLPGARSILVLALPYYQGAPPAPPTSATPAARGRIARYAWGDDYHPLIEKKMVPLSELLASWGGQQRAYVDTGPILERDFASEAGVGWNGKSTMQIDRQLGTWFFLAEILTTIALPPDAPEKDRCGSCTRCMVACPTQAITRERHLDARRCLSYLTIEHKGAIPEEFRKTIGDRLYGCDDCLEACPWNRFASYAREMAFALRPTHQWPLRDYLALDEEAFRQLFRGSPIKRLKRPRFLRNVCVVLGNIGTPEDLPALQKATLDPDPLIAEHAQWAASEVARRNHSRITP